LRNFNKPTSWSSILIVNPDALAQQCQQAVIAALTAETGPLGNNFSTRIRENPRKSTVRQHTMMEFSEFFCFGGGIIQMCRECVK
jgi:hypothetical protein